MAADREPKSPEPAAEPKSTEPAAWTPKSVAELLAITSLFAYGVTYLACVLFYGPLGAEPSDVGLGYAEILAQAAVFS